jgi:hypothetical protein
MLQFTHRNRSVAEISFFTYALLSATLADVAPPLLSQSSALTLPSRNSAHHFTTLRHESPESGEEFLLPTHSLHGLLSQTIPPVE